MCVDRKHARVVGSTWLCMVVDLLLNRKCMVVGPTLEVVWALVAQDLELIHTVMGVTKFSWT